MTDTPDPSSSLPAADEAIVAAFARRLAERDNPPPDPHRFERPQVENRLGRAAMQRLGGSRGPRLRALGRILYALVERPRLPVEALALTADLHPDAARRLARELLDDGLLTRERVSWSFEYSLSRAGEDWALPIVRDEAPKGGVGSRGTIA